MLYFVTTHSLCLIIYLRSFHVYQFCTRILFTRMVVHWRFVLIHKHPHGNVSNIKPVVSGLNSSVQFSWEISYLKKKFVYHLASWVIVWKTKKLCQCLPKKGGFTLNIHSLRKNFITNFVEYSKDMNLEQWCKLKAVQDLFLI